MYAIIAKNFRDLSAYWIGEIFLVLYSAHMIFKNQDEIVFYIYNYIDWV